MLTRKNASLLLIAALAASSANLQAQEPDLPLTPYMGGPVELVETQNGTIANKHLLEGIGSGVMVSDAEGRPRIGLGLDEGIPGIALVDEKGAKILTMGGGGSGKGIAVNNKAKKSTFMKMIEVQAGLGMGIKKFRLIWVFENKSDLDMFINSGWEIGGQATAAAQASGEGASLAGAMSIKPGVWLYQLTDDGLALELTAKGTKYYKDDNLN